jgi:hypothetical protein
MSWDRIKGQWKLQRGKAGMDEGVAAIARKHEDRVAKHEERNEIAANHAPTTVGLGHDSNLVQAAIQRLKKCLG